MPPNRVRDNGAGGTHRQQCLLQAQVPRLLEELLAQLLAPAQSVCSFVTPVPPQIFQGPGDSLVP